MPWSDPPQPFYGAWIRGLPTGTPPEFCAQRPPAVVPGTVWDKPRDPSVSVPDGLTLGRPFRTLSAGVVRSRFDGEPLDGAPPITATHLADMARLVRERAEEDPVILDFNHGSAIGLTSAEAGALGLVVDAFVADEGDGRGAGLYVHPAYNARGLAALEDNAGALWNSPEFVLGPVFDRAGAGAQLGVAQLLAVALTPRPAQVATTIDAVRLSETHPAPGRTEDPMADQVNDPAVAPSGEDAGGEHSVESLLAENEALRAQIAGFEAQLADGGKVAEAAVAVAASERTALEGEVAKLTAKVEQLTERNTLADVESQILGDCIAPAQREHARALLLSDRRTGTDFYTRMFGEGSPHRVPLGELGHAKTFEASSADVETEIQRRTGEGQTRAAAKRAMRRETQWMQPMMLADKARGEVTR